MDRFRGRVLIYVFSFAVAVVLATFGSGCETTCEDSCDDEYERAACEGCTEGPIPEKECIDLYCGE